ncbi:hypothetical protein JW859_07440 [bacterium]|nr:hypothetical protein [bacterium]
MIVFVLLVASCGSSGLPESSLTIRNAATNALISASEAQGTLTLSSGNTQQVRVMRTYRTETGNTFTDEVTQFANYKWESGTGVASVDQLGNVSGLIAGTAVLEVKFRENAFDPWDICKLTVVVN